MALLYITEFNNPQFNAAMPQAAMEPPVAEQVITFSGTHAESAALNSKTNLVRLQADGICSVLFSVAGTAATTSNQRMTAGQTEYKNVQPGTALKISVVTNT